MKNLILLFAAGILISTQLHAQDWAIGGNALGAGSNDFGATDNKPLDFITSTGVVRMTLTNTGRLGLGISAPTAQLQVYMDGSITKPQLLLTESAVDFARLKFSNSAVASRNWLIQAKCDGAFDVSSELKFSYTSSGITSDYMSVSGNGNVGIGNAFYTSRLSVSAPNTYYEDAISAQAGYFTTGLSSVAMHGISTGPYGIKVGIWGESANPGDANYGVKGTATGLAQTNYGVYGSASGGSMNYGGFFEGRVYISEKLLIGTTDDATGYDVCIGGKVICEELKVQLEASWPDYVFESDYPLMSISETEKYIQREKHLPAIQPACEIQENGLEVGDMQKNMTEELEKQMLYIIDLQHQIEALKAQMEALNN